MAINKDKSSSAPLSQGVNELIDRLREKGVRAGQQEADRIIEQARQKASALLKEANDTSQQLLKEARRQAEAEKKAAHDACEIAARDTILTMRGLMGERLAEDVRRLVQQNLQAPDLLRSLILTVAGRAAVQIQTSETEQIDILLPKHAIGLEDIRENPGKLKDDPLTATVIGLTRDMLKEGVEFKANPNSEEGLRLRLIEREIELDLSDKVIAELLLEHLQPRFRALLEGIVR
ncbi:hypothetical protein [Flexibacterium corallicola]|uniref:hypothetical protein n=1 Tax=Flexibacterium corallicola TaxID=3037259 RepID=UPI00286F28EE|nr:hypothetical protein [Pseudovibrio sp. M1P-2-3]